MSSKKMLFQELPVSYATLCQLFFLLFMFVSCTDGGSFSFPTPKPENFCTYNVTFNEGTSQIEIDKQKETMKGQVVRNTRSSEDGIQCDPVANWVKIDDLHWQLELGLHCFRLSDTSTVRPPSGTKPPPARVSSGTVEKSGCPEDDIKK